MNPVSITLLVSFVVNTLIGVGVFASKIKNRNNLFYFFLVLSISAWIFSNFVLDFISSYAQGIATAILGYISMLGISYFFFFFSYYFPTPTKKLSPLLYWLVNLTTLLSILIIFTPGWMIETVELSPWKIDTGTGVYIPFATFLVIMLLSFATLIQKNLNKTLNEIERWQVRIMLFGTIVTTLLGVIFNLVYPLVYQNYEFVRIGPIFTIILVSSVAYAIVKYSLFHLKVIATQLFTFVLWIFIFIRFLLSPNLEEQVINGILLALTLIIGIFLILSVIKEVEQREHIEKLAKDLEDANRRQESLLHFIGHEIKGYFTKSHWALSSMIDGDYGEIAPDLKMLTTQALADTKQGIDMVEGILKAGNLKKGTVTYEMKPFDFKGEVKNVIEMLKSNIEAKKLTLQLNIDENQDYAVTGDGEQMSKHVLRNLIDNAIKYTPSGTITIHLSKNNGKVLFSVKDSGVGITEEDKKRLFTEGGRGKDSVKVNVHSTGYGLFIAKQIVDAHKGRIWADSAGPGKGSTFFVEI